MREILILGGGGHAKVVIGLLKREAHWSILGYTDIVCRGGILGVGYLGDDAALGSISERYGRCSAALGVGQVDSSRTRRRLVEHAQALSFVFPRIVSPHAVVGEETSVAEGSVVLDGALVNAGASIGRFCILNSHCTVEHDCTIGDFVHVCPGAVLGGGVRVGGDVLIGAGSCVVQGVKICTGSVVGAGSVVIGDISEPGVYAGNPARRIG